MTAKAHFNKIVSKAETISRHLAKVKAEAKSLIEDIGEHADGYDWDDYQFNLAYLSQTLEKLISTDIDEAIPNKRKH